MCLNKQTQIQVNKKTEKLKNKIRLLLFSLRNH